MATKRETLIAQRTALMALVETERAENEKQGIKHLSRAAHKILDQVWVIDVEIQKLTYVKPCRENDESNANYRRIRRAENGHRE
jgi:hypothetical protein